MAQSLNTRADFTVDAIANLGFSKYGKIMVGDRALEFFSERSSEDNMQFPWESIRAIQGSVHGKRVGRDFFIVLQNGHRIRFSTSETGKLLKIIRENIGNDKVVKVPTVIGNLKKFLIRIFKIQPKKSAGG